jgi:hypothetical protein
MGAVVLLSCRRRDTLHAWCVCVDMQLAIERGSARTISPTSGRIRWPREWRHRPRGAHAAYASPRARCGCGCSPSTRNANAGRAQPAPPVTSFMYTSRSQSMLRSGRGRRDLPLDVLAQLIPARKTVLTSNAGPHVVQAQLHRAQLDVGLASCCRQVTSNTREHEARDSRGKPHQAECSEAVLRMVGGRPAHWRPIGGIFRCLLTSQSGTYPQTYPHLYRAAESAARPRINADGRLPRNT